MKFDANTSYEEVSFCKIASYKQNSKGKTVLLGHINSEYFVALFTDDSAYGSCLNAQGFQNNRDKAWLLFMEIINSFIEEKSEPN